MLSRFTPSTTINVEPFILFPLGFMVTLFVAHVPA
jgi:hypothetical protein